MELVLNTFETEPLPEPKETFTLNEPLLNSNYKSVANENFIKSSKPSIFKMRQRLKFKQFNGIHTVGVALKLSVFIFTLSMIF